MRIYYQPSPDGCPIEVKVYDVSEGQALIRAVGGFPFSYNYYGISLLTFLRTNYAVVNTKELFIIKGETA